LKRFKGENVEKMEYEELMGIHEKMMEGLDLLRKIDINRPRKLSFEKNQNGKFNCKTECLPSPNSFYNADYLEKKGGKGQYARRDFVNSDVIASPINSVNVEIKQDAPRPTEKPEVLEKMRESDPLLDGETIKSEDMIHMGETPFQIGYDGMMTERDHKSRRSSRRQSEAPEDQYIKIEKNQAVDSVKEDSFELKNLPKITNLRISIMT
jgi:hypothetical protein